jgi:hypothetical protein
VEPIAQSPRAKRAREMPSDPTVGYVSVQDIANVFSEQLRKLDLEIAPAGGRIPGRMELLTFVETIKFHLFARAENNLKDFLKRNPLTPGAMVVAADAGAAAADEMPVDSRAEYEARRAKLAQQQR